MPLGNIMNTTSQSGILSGTIGYIEALIGGIFGIYLLLVILRWYESRVLVNILKDIRHDIRKLSEDLGHPLEERETFARKLSNSGIRKKLKKKLTKSKK